MSTAENPPPMNADDGEKTKTGTSDRPLLRVLVNVLMVIVLGVLAVLVWQRVVVGQAQTPSLPFLNSIEDPAPTTVVEDTPNQTIPAMSVYEITDFSSGAGISRVTDVQTVIPSRTGTDVMTYTVKKGDTLFEIADTFGIRPETVLFGNYDVLEDNPHVLSPNMVLNILPLDGALYEWRDGDSLEFVSGYYRVAPEDIVEYSGNDINLTALESTNHGIEPGTKLIVPGGTRPIKDWGPPAITRQNPASARSYGAGHCGQVYSGAYGTGTFVWPTVSRGISGYGYSGVHPAIDIGGATGNAIFASDSGVVVYAGWSDYGYGYLIVIDHGNGFQTAYAHLSAVAVTCGQSVFQGGYIGAMGSTGNSSGAHLHFELIYNGAKPNPLDYLQ